MEKLPVIDHYRQFTVAFCFKPQLFRMLAFLVRNGTACFASRLAGSLALAASTFCCRFFQVCFVQGFNMFHDFFSLLIRVAFIISYYF